MASSKNHQRPTQQPSLGEGKHSNQINAQTIMSYLLHMLLTCFELPFRYLFGRDIFISYSRSDASKYAPNLALALQAKRPKLSFYLDRWLAPPSGKLPRSLKRHLRWSSILVVVCTENAIRSEFVRDEISSFSKLGRKVIPIDVDGAFYKADREQGPWSEISGASSEEESLEAVVSGHPSENVVERILKSVEFTGQERRLRRAVWSTLTFVALSIGGALLFSHFTVKEANAKAHEAELREQKAIEKADAADNKAQNADKKAAEAESQRADAEAKTVSATSRANAAETKAIDEEGKARDASVRAEKADSLRVSAEAKATRARKQEAEALKSAAIAGEREQGSRASLLAREPGRDFEAAALAASAASTNFKWREPDEPVLRGLVTSVMQTDYTLRLNLERRVYGPAQISPDGSLLFVQSLRPNNSFRWEVFDLRHKTAPLVIEEGSHATHAAFSRNNKRLMVIGRLPGTKMNVKVWDLSDTQSAPKPFFSSGPAALDDTGERITLIRATGRGPQETDKEIIVENLRTGEVERYPVERGLSTKRIVFNRVGEVVLQAVEKRPGETSPSQSKLLVYSQTKKGDVLGVIDAGFGDMVGFSDDHFLVTSYTDPKSPNKQTIYHMVDSRRIRRMLTGYMGAVNSVSLGKEPRVVLSRGGALNISDTRANPNYYALRGLDGEISNIVFSPDGTLIATSSEGKLTSNKIKIWKSGTGEPLRTLNQSGQPKAFAFSQDNSRLAVITHAPETVKIFDIATGEDAKVFCSAKNLIDQDSGIPVAISFLHNDKYIAFAHHRGLLVVWDASNCQPVKVVTLHFEGQGHIDGGEFKRAVFHKALFTTNGESLVTERLTQDYSSRQENTEAHIWDLNGIGLSGSPVNNGQSLLPPARLTSKVPPISNPPEWWLHAVTQPLGEIQLLFIREDHIKGGDGSPHVKLESKSNARNASFSNDGRPVLAGVERNRRTGIWDAQHVQQILNLLKTEISFTTATIAPDGKSFAIGGVDGTVRVYPATAEGLLGVATNLAQKVPE